MHSLEADGISIAGNLGRSKFLPYRDILNITKLNLAESILTGFNLLKPGVCETYMGVYGDPLHVMMIETKEGRYLVHGDDLDPFIAEANERLRAYREKTTNS